MKSLFSLLSLMITTIFLSAQNVSIHGVLRDQADRSPIPYVNVLLFDAVDNGFVRGTLTDEEGVFTLSGIKPGEYLLEAAYLGYETQRINVHAGKLNPFINLGNIFLKESIKELEEITISGRREDIGADMDRKTYLMDQNLSQLGGSVLQAMQNLPGVTIDREGKVQLRGSDRVAVLIDGQQSAITGFGAQSGLDNIPASAIERIEIINNPSARYDATGMAGIINIVFKKQEQYGWNGKIGITGGIGALGIKRSNMPGIRDQYQFTPKINPSASVNFRKEKLNFFGMADILYHQQMMKNEFIERTYSDGLIIDQQFLENRTQPIYNIKSGIDWYANERNTFTFSGLYNYRAYTDLGDLPYFDRMSGDRLRLWEYYENEVNQTLLATLLHKHQFRQPGHLIESTLNYSFRRKDEVFYFTNFLPDITGTDTTSLIADENVLDLTVDYQRPVRHGRYEIGTKQRARIFPNDIIFQPGQNSILDPALAGYAEYREWLSAIYGNYIYESRRFEVEAGLRLEYARIDYLVDPAHAVYQSDGFQYTEPFPSLRMAWILNDRNRLSVFYNRRVDRPEERNLRVFPTYADPEILRLGNPTLLPQFTQSVELGYKLTNETYTVYAAAYHRMSTNLLTRIITQLPGESRLSSIDQNAGNGTNSGVEAVLTTRILQSLSVDFNANTYRNVIDAFTIINAYPQNISFSRGRQTAWSGNTKINLRLKLPAKIEAQLTGIYLAADIVPQGRIDARYSLDFGLKKTIQQGKGELFLNATDILNTMVIRYELEGDGFELNSTDYYETQVLRIGYQYRF